MCVSSHGVLNISAAETFWGKTPVWFVLKWQALIHGRFSLLLFSSWVEAERMWIHEPRGKIRRVTAQLLDRFLSVGLCLCWQEEQWVIQCCICWLLFFFNPSSVRLVPADLLSFGWRLATRTDLVQTKPISLVHSKSLLLFPGNLSLNILVTHMNLPQCEGVNL